MLAPQARGAVVIASLMAAGRFDAIGSSATDLVEAGADLLDLREAAYLASLFCGFPRGVAALLELAKLDGGHEDSDRSRGDRVPCHTDTPPVERALSRSIGDETFRAIHRTNAKRQLDMLRRVHPDFADTVLAEAYGRVIAREFLPLSVRELIGVASLSVQRLDAQLRAHLLGAHNTGASFADIRETLRLAADTAGVNLDDATTQLDGLEQRLDANR